MLPDADFSSADLYQTHFAGAQLPGARLTGAELTYADFRHADLSRVDASQATLFRAVLHGARTEDAVMPDRPRALETDPDLAEAENWNPMENNT